ncbi:hypothetical protein LCGC14_1763580, partial [marine sediment metagenome]
MPGVRMMYKKSILFEIVQRKNPGTPVESFTLTIPPENMEIEEDQRISETETFGGVFLDDYGEGLKPIRISGHTGGSTLRLTYSRGSSKNKGKKFDGRSAFFYFRDTLMRYKSVESRKTTYQNYDLYIYDLSTIPAKQDISMYPIENIAEGYACYLKKFKMTRSKERPLFYNYSIELVAVRALGTYNEMAKSPVPSTNNPLSLIGALRRGLRLTKGYFTDVRNVMDSVSDVLDVIDDLEGQLRAFINQAGDLVYYPFALASRVLTMIVGLTDLAEAAYTTMVVTAGKSETTFYNILSILRGTSSSSAALVAYSKTPDASARLINKISREDSRVQSSIAQFKDLTEQESEITSNVLSQSIATETIYYIYGYIIVSARQDTTLERLSIEYFDSVDFIELIAIFNGIKGDSEIESGDQIRIPVITKGKNPENNYVYSDLRGDIYGSDIRLDASGKVVVMASGDLARVEGVDNLVQAANLRLNDQLGSRLRLTLYGIQDSIGFARGETTPVAYVIVGIKDTLM